jgi:hypothetical protein
LGHTLAVLLARAQDEVLTRQQALRTLSPTALRHKLASGRWQRIYRGVYLTRPGPITVNQRQWAAVLALGGDRQPPSACLGGVGALRVWGLSLVRSSAIDVVLLDRGSERALRGVAIHHATVPTQVERGWQRPPTTLPGRSLVDAVAWARSDREAQLIIAASFQQRIVRLADVQRAADERRTAKRRSLLLAVAEDCAGGSHSIGELDLLALCRRAGLPTPTRQAARRDRHGRIRFLDVLFEPWKVAVEIDGVHHLDVVQAWADAQRANDLELAGYVVLRFPAHAVRTEPERVIADIRAALTKAGWPT